MVALPAQRLEPALKVSEKTRRLWDALHEYVRSQGGAVVSVRGLRVMRVQCGKDSPIPVKLAEASYDVRHGGMLTRIDGGKFLSVIEIEIVLPGK